MMPRGSHGAGVGPVGVVRAADQHLGQVHPEHDVFDVRGNGPLGEQRRRDHHAERQRHGPHRGLAEEGRPPAVGGRAEHRRHEMPRTISGQNDDAAMAKAQPTSRPSGKRLTGRATSVAIVPAMMAQSRNVPTFPRMTSCDSAPATLTSRPEEVDRKAAKAPAATSAPSSSPGRPGMSREGSPKTKLSGSLEK